MYDAKVFELVRQTLLPRRLTENAGLGGAHPAVYWREENRCLLRTDISCSANFYRKEECTGFTKWYLWIGIYQEIRENGVKGARVSMTANTSGAL